MSHRISEEDLAYDAAVVLEECFRGSMTLTDGRQYEVVQVEHDGARMVIEVRGTRYLDVRRSSSRSRSSCAGRTDRWSRGHPLPCQCADDAADRTGLRAMPSARSRAGRR